MITTLAAVLLCALASAAPAPGPGGASASPAAAPAAAPSAPAAPAPSAAAGSRRPSPTAVHASTAAALSASASEAFGVSTYTVSTLYTGDKVRDPFLPPSMGGGPARGREKNAPIVVDIHTLALRGIMKDANSDFAIFTMDTGGTLILRGGHLYDDHKKRVPGITGSIHIKQKSAELITADKDRQPYTLGETDVKKSKDKSSDETGETGSGRSP